MKRSISMIIAALLMFQQASPYVAAETVVTGEVTAMLGGEIACSRGDESGVREGDEGVIYYLRTIGGQSVRLTVARVQVKSVFSGSSSLRVTDQTAEIRVGYRVDIGITTVPEAVKPPAKKQQPVLRPQKSNKKWYIIGGAVLVGGAAAAMLSRKKNGDDSGTASVSVTLPE
jgi:hypothetical protein